MRDAIDETVEGAHSPVQHHQQDQDPEPVVTLTATAANQRPLRTQVTRRKRPSRAAPTRLRTSIPESDASVVTRHRTRLPPSSMPHVGSALPGMDRVEIIQTGTGQLNTIRSGHAHPRIDQTGDYQFGLDAVNGVHQNLHEAPNRRVY